MKENMKNIYSIATKFLIKKIPSQDAQNIMNQYLNISTEIQPKAELSELLRRMLSSAQNSNMKAGVIGKAIGGVNNLEKALFSFDSNKILKKFNNAPDALLDHIVKTLNPNGKIRREAKSIWPKYCQTILSSAVFFSQFSDGDEFYEWANSLYKNKRSLPALPMILAAEIEGIGYPLACDFLKELGFINYGKPDVHVIEIFVGIGMCQPKPSPYQVQKIITQIATESNTSSYNVDKIFWLIGSGKFYKHEELWKNGLIGQMKEEFINSINRSRKA